MAIRLCASSLRRAASSMRSMSTVAVGDVIPGGISLHRGFPPEKVDVADYLAKKTAIVVGLPGAFTPT